MMLHITSRPFLILWLNIKKTLGDAGITSWLCRVFLNRIDMALSSPVMKVCGMREVENVRVVAALDPTYLGFIFVPGSSRYLDPFVASKPWNEVPSHIGRVGVFQDAKVATIVDTALACGLNIAQLHGDEDRAFIDELHRAAPGLLLWKALAMDDEQPFKHVDQYLGAVEMFVFDSGSGGTGEKFNWEVVTRYTGQVPFLLAGGIGPGDWDLIQQSELLAMEAFAGIDVNSRVELSPGVKDAELVKRLLEQVRR